MTAAERLAALLGAWSFARIIRHADGTRARAWGTATWAPEGPVLRCTETGTLEQGRARLRAERVTLWRADGPRLHVAFSDGRPFHDFEPTPWAEALHPCAPDTYRLGYDFRGRGFWSCRWRVTGPRKDYVALTRYRRVAGASPRTPEIFSAG
ncbi:DUF6314 family protein [Jannaschia sp. W003]|uniref:DUF6314 family protein n=1 Tax=Jannaschia sp. W003 TaxID=2867012 RepID=UPI0021A51021|nr:DUF6314 family protein [Jannaschia sp. W003]UWQ20187.1 DUF6314 family protein [Jannaschia sp. W003]